MEVILYDMTNMSTDLEIVPFSRPLTSPIFVVTGQRQNPYRPVIYKHKKFEFELTALLSSSL